MATGNYTIIQGLDLFQGVSFAYLTPLELLYPTVAYCDLGLVYYWDAVTGIFWLIFNRWYQVPINTVRWLGTILYNFLTSFDCLWLLDGECFGTKVGTWIYKMFYFRDMYYTANLAAYDAALVPLNL